MTRHYVLVADYGYEGASVRGSFSTIDEAKAYADSYFEGEEQQFVEEFEGSKYHGRIGRIARQGEEWEFYG